jgi:hypothetical protein
LAVPYGSSTTISKVALVSAASGIKKTLPPGRDLRFGYLSLPHDAGSSICHFYCQVESGRFIFDQGNNETAQRTACI